MKEESLAPADLRRMRALREELSAWASVPPQAVRTVRSPYRVCPLGAHVDHQLGHVTGMALDRALLLGFVPREDGAVAIRSRQFAGVVEFVLADPARTEPGDWADYARGAAFALGKAGSLRRGITAVVDGHDDVGGLSSSAAVGVAYLLALEAANDLELSPAENIELDRVIENDYIGLSNGVLDQSVILLSRPGHLTCLDCRTGRSRLVPFGGLQEVCLAVLFSGLSVPLSETDYNRRVGECRQAASRLLGAAGMSVPEPPHLRAVPPDAFKQYGHLLPEHLRRRAAHFFTEQERVQRGVDLWRRGDLAGFGRLVTESGRSSIENYECGNPYLRTAYEVLRDCPGVYGARFSGAGFRGCCIALVRPECVQQIAGVALSRYLEAHPDMAGKAKLYFCRPAEGAAVLD